jgi:DNA invertase Pin-like site-specific DNA recombinase
MSLQSAASRPRKPAAKPETKPAAKPETMNRPATSGADHLIGYARVSTTDQDATTQEAKLKVAGCAVVRTEKMSGQSREGRSELESVMEFVRPGDTLVVVKLDRLGRSTRDVLNLIHDLDQRGASLRVLEPVIDTAGPMGRMVLTVLGMVAEMELGFIKDRQRAGIEAAKAKGLYKGRPVTFDHARIIALRKDGMGATDIARAVGCKRGNVYKALKAAGIP